MWRETLNVKDEEREIVGWDWLENTQDDAAEKEGEEWVGWAPTL